MAPQSNDDFFAMRFDRLETKLEDLRKELMASFVLKQVFEMALEARDKEFAELKKDFEEHRQAEMGKLQRYLLVTGGILGLITAIINILEHFHL